LDKKRDGEIKMVGKDNFGREMHKVTCADCGQETEVPFKPDGARPVYCRDCYQKHRKPRREY
jgi:CxxC-x17-CxxC domain-containing protein